MLGYLVMIILMNLTAYNIRIRFELKFNSVVARNELSNHICSVPNKVLRGQLSTFVYECRPTTFS